MPAGDDYQYFLSLKSVRDQAYKVYNAAVAGSLVNFEFHEKKLDGAADYVVETILRDWSPESFKDIPPHGRWQHFSVGGIPRLDQLVSQMETQGADRVECARRVVDIILVSVLLDAGAGDEWKYTEGDLKIGRSEGLAVASFHAFKSGVFGENCVDANALEALTSEKLANAMQSTPENLLVGVEGRADLLRSLGRSLTQHPDIFGAAQVRPGNMVDLILQNKQTGGRLNFSLLWQILQDLLLPAWPTDRTTIDSKAIGDAWPLEILKRTGSDSRPAIQPFHKLTQWLAYSLTSALTRLLQLEWNGLEALTGLPEYRNGGFFVDMGVLTLKPEVLARGLQESWNTLPQFSASDDVIVEWRAMTVVLLDIITGAVNEKLKSKFGPETIELSLAQVLEAGTWKAGRELAKIHREEFKACSPILIVSDGTLF